MKKGILLSIAALLFLGCGGSSSTNTSSADTTSVTKTTIKGKVADGYLENAKVCLDKNNNLACDEDEPFTYTNSMENIL